MARAKEFSFSQDRDLTLWKETFLYNGMHAAGAEIVFGTVMLLTGSPVYISYRGDTHFILSIRT